MEGIKFPRSQFEKILKDSALDNKPPKDEPRTAFLEAVRWVKAKSHTNNLLIRTIDKNKDAHYFALVDEEIDKKAKQAGYNHSATLQFDQKTHSVSCNKKHRALDLVQARYQENLDNLNSYDLRRWTQKVLDKLHNVSVRDKGGVYYVDAKYTGVLETIEQVLAQVNGVDFVMMEQVDTERSKKAIWKCFVNDLKHKITKFNEALDNDKFTSNKGWENKLKEFKKLREEVGFYADRLQFTGDDLDKSLTDLGNKVKVKLAD